MAVGGKGGRTGGEEFEAVVALDGRSHVDVGRNGEGHLGVLELDAARRLGVLRSSQAQTGPQAYQPPPGGREKTMACAMVIMAVPSHS